MSTWSDRLALVDDPAAKLVSARPLDHNVNRPEAIESIKQWLSDCVNHHQQCVLRNDTAVGSTTPKRLIRVETDLDGTLKVNLVSCSDQEPRPYAALSYCWGVAQNVVLTEAKIEAWYTEVSAASLPQSIQDALSVVNGLGIQYLWVDALCIIQDSSTDKDEEISVMNLIYEQAELTICVGIAAACTEGFLQKRLFGEVPMPTLDYSALQIACPTGEQGTVLVKTSQNYYTNNEPLYERAWTLQEQMLSSRVLVYSSCQVWWECLEVKGCDRGKPQSIVSNGGTIGSLPHNGLAKRVERSLNHNCDYLWESWKEIVMDYSGRKLSVATDKLPALSALASSFTSIWNCPYYAGLWERKLLEGLRWYSHRPPSWKPDEDTAPSWSWASTVGSVGWEDKPYEEVQAENSPAEHTRIVECRTTLTNNNVPFGQVTGGSLVIEGSAQWIEWDGQEQVEAMDLSPDFHVIRSTEMGSPLFPEGIVALARPDYDQIELSSTSSEPTSDAVTPDSSTITFWMGIVVQAENNEVTMRILLLVISRTTALMLFALDNHTYERMGLLAFRSEKDMESYFLGSHVERVVIR